MPLGRNLCGCRVNEQRLFLLSCAYCPLRQVRHQHKRYYAVHGLISRARFAVTIPRGAAHCQCLPWLLSADRAGLIFLARANASCSSLSRLSRLILLASTASPLARLHVHGANRRDPQGISYGASAPSSLRTERIFSMSLGTNGRKYPRASCRSDVSVYRDSTTAVSGSIWSPAFLRIASRCSTVILLAATYSPACDKSVSSAVFSSFVMVLCLPSDFAWNGLGPPLRCPRFPHAANARSWARNSTLEFGTGMGGPHRRRHEASRAVHRQLAVGRLGRIRPPARDIDSGPGFRTDPVVLVSRTEKSAFSVLVSGTGFGPDFQDRFLFFLAAI